MLWHISSGDLDAIIVSDRDNLSENIIKTIETKNPNSLGMLLFARRLTGWPDSTTIDELESEDIFYHTVNLLREFDKLQD